MSAILTADVHLQMMSIIGVTRGQSAMKATLFIWTGAEKAHQLVVGA
jgi:hypothetical protein